MDIHRPKFKISQIDYWYDRHSIISSPAVVFSLTLSFVKSYLCPLHSSHKTDRALKSSISFRVNCLSWKNIVSAASAGMWNVTATQPFSMLRSCNVDAFRPKIFATAA